MMGKSGQSVVTMVSSTRGRATLAIATLVAIGCVAIGIPDAVVAQTWGTEVRKTPNPSKAPQPAPAPQPVPQAAPQPVPPPAPVPQAAQAPPPPAAGAAGVTGNTTVITKTPGATTVDKGRAAVLTLQAVLVEGGSRIDQGLVWRVFDARAVEGKHRLVTTVKDAAPSLRLAAGEYLVHVAFGRAHLTRKLAVKGTEAQAETFVLNAGGLRVSAFLASGEAAPERSASCDIFSDERDQFGNRTKVMSGVRAGLIVRLNAGIYHIVSTYGDANATERADVTVEAGKLTEASVRHSAARVTFKLVAAQGGEAQADIRWSVHGPDGQLVKESLGALPTHILQAGSYKAVAKQGEASFGQAFTVSAGEVRQIEVMMK